MNPATLQVLIERARSASDAARARHAGAVRAAEQARAHFDLLRQYTAEYEDRARYHAGDSRDLQAEENRRRFQGRLGVAVDAQRREVEVRERALCATAEQVTSCQKKLKSLQTLARRQEAERLQVEARRDQKRTDEFAQRRAHAGGMRGGWR